MAISPFTRRVLTVAGVALLSILGLLLLWYGFSLILVVFAAVLFAVLLDGLTRLVALRTPLSHGWGFAVVVLVLLVLLGSATALVGTRVTSQFDALVERTPEAIDALEAGLREHEWGRLLLSNAEKLEEAASSQQPMMQRVTGAFSTMASAVMYGLVALLIGFYAALHRSLYVAGALHLVPPARRDRAREVVGALGHALRWWFVGRFSSMAVVGVLTAVGLMVLDVPLALVLGLLAALFSFVPYVGPLVSAVPAILMGLLQSPMTAVLVAGLFALVQFLESYFITPLIQRRTVSLPPALLITAQLLLGYAAGALGVLLATPLAVVVIVLVQMLYVEDTLGDTSFQVLGA